MRLFRYSRYRRRNGVSQTAFVLHSLHSHTHIVTSAMAQLLNIWQHAAARNAAPVAAAAAVAAATEPDDSALIIDPPSSSSLPSAPAAAAPCSPMIARSHSSRSASLVGPVTQASGSVADADAHMLQRSVTSGSVSAAPLSPLQHRRHKRKARSVHCAVRYVTVLHA